MRRPNVASAILRSTGDCSEAVLMKRLGFVILTICALVVIVAACSSGAASPPLTSVGNSAPNAGTTEDGTGRELAAATSAPATQGPAAPGAPEQPMIVYTGSLDLQVDDVRAKVDQADQLVAGLGGHVASSEASDKADFQSATVTYRIPSERWDEALTGLRAVGTKVLNESIQSEDVTGQVVDLDARIANLRASESALQAIMARASSIPDVLKVQDELTSVRGDIESMTAQRDSLANKAQFATLKVTFEKPAPAQTTVAQTGWDLGQTIDDAVAALVRVGQGVLTLGIWTLVVVVPIVVPVLIVLWIAVWLRRRWVRNHAQVTSTPTSTM
jgi:hypothetical protein